MQTANGSLVLLDLHANPKVFWRGAEVHVESLLASKGDVMLRVKRGSLAAETLADMLASGINVKEIQ